MRDTLKFLPILLLGTTLGACSMAGTGDYYAGEYAQKQHQQLPHIYSAPAGCAYTGCAPQNSYPVAQANHAPQTPSHHAYGQSVQGHPAYGVPAHTQPHHGAHKGLRQAYTYGSLGATMYDVDSDLYGAQARLGWQSASFFGAELEGSLGFKDDEATVDFGTGPIAAESGIDSQIAAFGVARLPVSHRLNVLGRVGYHNTDFSAEFDDGVTVLETDFSTDGIAYGVGAEYAFNPRTSLRADYTRYDFDGADADAVSLAIARKF